MKKFIQKLKSNLVSLYHDFFGNQVYSPHLFVGTVGRHNGDLHVFVSPYETRHVSINLSYLIKNQPNIPLPKGVEVGKKVLYSLRHEDEMFVASVVRLDEGSVEWNKQRM